MKKLNISAILALVMIAFSCKTSTEILGSWTNPDANMKSYKSIFVTAISNTIVSREVMENELETMLQKEGVKSETSLEILPSGFKDNADNKEETIEAIRKRGGDAILTVALLDQDSETRYVPGTTMYSPMSYGGYYGRFSGYYSYYNPVMYDPGYYTTDKFYYYEINLYDSKTEELVWSAQSETVNPESAGTFANTFSQEVVEQLIEDGFISK